MRINVLCDISSISRVAPIVRETQGKIPRKNNDVIDDVRDDVTDDVIDDVIVVIDDATEICSRMFLVRFCLL